MLGSSYRFSLWLTATEKGAIRKLKANPKNPFFENPPPVFLRLYIGHRHHNPPPPRRSNNEPREGHHPVKIISSRTVSPTDSHNKLPILHGSIDRRS